MIDSASACLYISAFSSSGLPIKTSGAIHRGLPGVLPLSCSWRGVRESRESEREREREPKM